MGKKIRLNGDEYITGAGTVEALLAELEVIPERVAVELNMRVIKKDRYSDTVITECDEVEIVSFVGGGNSYEQGEYNEG